MSENSNNIDPYNGILEIRQIFFAGKAAIDKNQLNPLFNSLENKINSLIENDLFGKKSEEIQIWKEIFDSAYAGQLAKELADFFKPKIYYEFGIYLKKYLQMEEFAQKSELKGLAHAYLNIFRLSEFLVKIYEEKKWESLIHEIILFSNYNVRVLFDQRTRDYKHKTLFKVLHGSSVIDYSWGEIADLVKKYRNSFASILEETGDMNSKVAFLCENSLNMALLDLACLTSGIVNIMIPANSVPEHISYILNETKAPFLIIANEKQLTKVKSVRSGLKYLKKGLLLQGVSAEDWLISLKKFQLLSENYKGTILDELLHKMNMDSLTSLMYTSGTTGEPKGIMFSQMNIVYKRFCRAMALPQIGDKDRFLAYLPLYHTFGRWFEMMGCVFWGSSYAFMENPSLETMILNMELVHPSVFISIPKKWVQLYESIGAQVDIEVDEEHRIHETVHEIAGGKLKWGLSAAGYLSPDIFQFFQKYGISLMSGFGMTEATGGITMTPPENYIPNSLGRALPGIELKLSEDGELLIKGPYVMMGYYGKDDSETFVDGKWLPTGDVMTMDEKGYIEIIDRKKEIYKNIKGETIAPQKIENYFRDFENIKQVFLVGDHRPYNTVLIFPEYELENSILTDMDENELRDYFSSVIVSVNQFLASFERILDFRIINRPFSAEEGELTPKGTYKRRVIEDNFSDQIESMYQKDHTAVFLDKTEVRIPNWFLREKGCLSSDIIALTDGISIPKLKLNLKIKKSRKDENIYRIGNFYYEIDSRFIELQTLLTNPIYWCGNQGILDFTGSSIIQWYRQDNIEKEITFKSLVNEIIPNDKFRENMKYFLSSGEVSLNALHTAVVLLQSVDHNDGFLAVQYLRILLEDETLSVYKVTHNILIQPGVSGSLPVRRELFKLAVKKLRGRELGKLLQLYSGLNYDFLNERVIQVIVESSKGNENLYAIETVISEEIARLEENKSFENSPVKFYFQLLGSYGIQHPMSYEKVRQILVGYQLRHGWEELKFLATETRNNLRGGFRNWLGANQSVAVDMETGEEYGWDDVIILEQDLDHEDSSRIIKAIKETPVLREAIFLFYNGALIGLNNILPGGVWVSHIETFPLRSVYRVSVQTRLQGSFDIVLSLNKGIPGRDISEEINWMILAGYRFVTQEIIEDFGGYWKEIDLWSQKLVPGVTVARFLKRETRKKDDTNMSRLYHLWPSFVWNAFAAHVHFWNLTGHKVELIDPSPQNVIVPSHDYQTGTRFVSLAERKYSTTLIDFFENFIEKFLYATEREYPFLERESIWNYIFSGMLDAEGVENGIDILKKLKMDIEKSQIIKDRDTVSKKLETFLTDIERRGFIPKQAYFAMKRFHRWFHLNADAALSAQAETQYELYETYNLSELEKSYPETRTRFFLETAFTESSDELKKALQDIVNKQNIKNINKEESLELLTNIQNEFKLSDKETFFLTRLSYPHLKPSDSAALMKSISEGAQTADLVVKLEDYDGNPFLLRKPVSPKEISRLHQLFLEENLLVHFHPDHRFLVAISERGYIIGGLYYLITNDETAHMEKIVVSNRYRRKGVSEGLMNEFFNRLKGAEFKYVTTGFFRPEYFYRFGFKIERKYSGLVKDLSVGIS